MLKSLDKVKNMVMRDGETQKILNHMLMINLKTIFYSPRQKGSL